MVKRVARNKQVLPTVTFKQGRGQPGLAHGVAHDADAAALGLGESGVVQHRCNARVAQLRSGLAQVFACLEREARVADFHAVAVANDLHRAGTAVAAVHQGIDDSLAHHAQRDGRCVATLKITFGQRECFGQVVKHRSLGAADQAKQGVTQFDAVKAAVGVGNPFTPGHADVVHAGGWKAPTQRMRCAEQDEPCHCRAPVLPALTLHPDAAQRLQQFLVRPAQLLCVGIGLGTRLAIVGQRLRGQVGQRGVGHHGSIKTLLLAPLIEDEQVIFRAMLVNTAHAPQRACRQAAALEVHGLVVRRRFGHMHHQHSLAINGFGADLHPHRDVEGVATLGGQVCRHFVRLSQTLSFVGWEQRQFFPHHAQQQPAATQARLVGKGAHGLQHRLAGFAATFGSCCKCYRMSSLQHVAHTLLERPHLRGELGLPRHTTKTSRNNLQRGRHPLWTRVHRAGDIVDEYEVSICPRNEAHAPTWCSHG